MASITFDRDGASVTAHTLTESSDAHTLIVKTEHSDSLPAVIELKRRLPSAQGSVRRAYVTRKQGTTLYSGTDQEQNALITGKLELSIPVGTPAADVTKVLNDIVGLIGTTEFGDLKDFGILSQ